VAGAVVGCLLAGFYLLRVHDMAVATYLAAAINIAVALLALGLAARTPSGGTLLPASTRALRARGVTLVYVTIGLSGLTALGAEVVWTRVLSLLLGATVYTFSIILAVFLLGLWAGSVAGSFLSRRVAQPRLALAACQILLAAAIAYTAFTLAYILPYWPVDPRISLSPWFNFDLDLTRTIKAILPATLLWGASFPLALAGAASADDDPGRLTGAVYAANTAGSIVGALAFSLVFIPQIGTRGSQQLLTCLAAAAGFVALGAFSAVIKPRPRPAYAAAAVVGVAIVAWGLSATIADVPWQVTAYGRRVASILRGLDLTTNTEEQPLFVGEGINSSVVITERADQRFFYVSGKSEASSAPLDMRLQRMMGNIPALFHPAPRSVLVIGFGAGVTAGSFVPYPEVRNIVICELEPMIPPASGQYFSKENYNVTRDGRARIIEDDARHFILAAREKFDIITTDPIHPWVKGTSTLYSKEFFELEKSHLNPGGVVAQWLPLYESDEATVKTQLATFFAVFPDATVWSNYANGDGYDLVLIGRENPSPINIDAVAARLAQGGYSGVAASLAEVGFPSAVELLSSYAGRAEDLQPMLTNAPLNEDLTMRLQYLAGMGLNLQIAPQIYRDILAYRKFPEDLITGTGDRINALRVLIGRRHRTF
jgi:spermidine synthase